MASVIVGFCQILVHDDTDGTLTATYSDLEGSWQRAAQIWDDGVSKYIFWGDTTGQITLYDLIIDANTCAADCLTASFSYGTSSTLNFYQGHPTTAKSCVTISGCYIMTDLVNKRLKQMGDRYILEGGQQYQIFI